MRISDLILQIIKNCFCHLLAVASEAESRKNRFTFVSPWQNFGKKAWQGGNK